MPAPCADWPGVFVDVEQLLEDERALQGRVLGEDGLQPGHGGADLVDDGRQPGLQTLLGRRLRLLLLPRRQRLLRLSLPLGRLRGLARVVVVPEFALVRVVLTDLMPVGTESAQSRHGCFPRSDTIHRTQ